MPNKVDRSHLYLHQSLANSLHRQPHSVSPFVPIIETVDYARSFGISGGFPRVIMFAAAEPAKDIFLFEILYVYFGLVFAPTMMVGLGDCLNSFHLPRKRTAIDE